MPPFLTNAMPALGSIATTAGTAVVAGLGVTTGIAAGIALSRWAFKVDLLASNAPQLLPQAFGQAGPMVPYTNGTGVHTPA